MKRQNMILLLFFSLFLSCEKVPPLTVTLSDTDTTDNKQVLIAINFPEQGGSQVVHFSTNKDWSVSTSESWCKVSSTSGIGTNEEVSIIIMCDPNDFYAFRNAVVSIKSDEVFLSINVTQNANFETFSEESFSFTINTAGTLKDIISEDLIHIIKALKLTGELNGTDIAVIRRMKSLQVLDISNTSIVSGGVSYYSYNSDSYYTADDVIGAYMFFMLKSLKQVLLPEGIKDIQSNAFNGTYLDYINIPNEVTNIGTGALYGSHFSYLVLPSMLQSIGTQAFTCSSIDSHDITIPENVESIAWYSFVPDGSTTIFHIKGNPNILKSIASQPFGEDDDAIVYVPKGTKSEYFLTELGYYTHLYEE